MLKLKNTMKLNKEQTKHLADTFRIIAIAQFGFFGYHGLIKWATQWETFVWSAAVFVVCEWAAVWFLEDHNGTD
ncbi:MAG: hypothetical protein ACYDHY_15950 [Acidiferrobacterales bacterium]